VGGDETISLPDMRQMYLTSAHHGRYVCASSIQRTIFANPKIALWTPRKIFKGETRHRGWLRPPSKLPLMRRSRGGTIECAGVFDTGLDVQAKNAVVRAVTTVGTMCIPHLRSRYLPARATGCLSGLRATDITFVQTYSSWRKSPSRHGLSLQTSLTDVQGVALKTHQGDEAQPQFPFGIPLCVGFEGERILKTRNVCYF